MDKLKMQSVDLTHENIEKIAKLFPNVVTEVKDENGNLKKAFDFDLLKQELSNEIIESEKERYQLTWPGKKEAIVTANTPINKTLRPVKEDSVDWDKTQNIYIEGDNLEVLKILQEGYLNKIKCIYIDPPYNTGKDFIYKDKFSQDKDEYYEESGQVDEERNRLFQNNESNGRFHSDWLTMIYSRLKLAQNLLSPDGVIFISIDDNEKDNLKKICDEIFGECNFVASLIWRGGKRNAAKYISNSHEYILFYSKNLSVIDSKNISWKIKKKGLDEIYSVYNSLISKFTNDFEKITRELKIWFKQLPEDSPAKAHEHFSWVDKRGIFFPDNISRGGGGGPQWEIKNPKTGNIVKTPSRGWAYSKIEDLYKDIDNDLIYFNGDGVPCRKSYLKEKEFELLDTVFYKDRRGSSKRLRDLMKCEAFDFPKDENIISEIINAVSDKESIILDFFSGSATTAHAVMQLNAEDGGNRKYIMVQLPEKCAEDSEAYKAGYKNICEIGKERIRRAAKKIKNETKADIDYGFRVFKVDSSNMKDVYYTPEHLKQNDLELFESNIKDDRNDEDLLIQVMLDFGLELSLPMETRKINGKNVHFVAGNSLVACFEEKITEDIIKTIAKEKPLRAVFRDSSFQSDDSRINVEEIFKMLSSSTDIKVI